MKRIFTFIGLLLLAQPDVSAQETGLTTITLKEAVEIAVSNNLGLKQSRLLADAANVYKRQAKTNMLPDLNAGVTHGINQGRSIDPFTNSYINQQLNFANYNLGSSLILFNGLRLQHMARQSALTYNATVLEWEQDKEMLTIDVILAYLQVLTTREQLKASISQAAITSKQVDRLEILHKQGAIAPSLFYDLQGQLANDQLAIVNNQNNLNATKLALSQLMNVPYNEKLNPDPLPVGDLAESGELSPAIIYEQAKTNLSVLKATGLRTKAAALGVKSSKSYYSPLVVLNANIYTNYSSAATRDILVNTIETPSSDFVDMGGTKLPVVKQRSNYNSERISYQNQFENNYNNSVNIGMRIPIFSGLRSRNQVALAKIDLKNAQFQEENAQTVLKQQIEQAYFNMTAARERYRLLNNQLTSFSASYRAAETRFNAGLSNQVEYLIAKNNLDSVNINLINARYDLLLRLKVLDFYQGELQL